MKATISAKLERNLSRVHNLVKLYETNLAGQGQGRRGHDKTDVLRAATVLLHSTLEDFVRSLAYWKLPVAGRDALDKIPFSNHGPVGRKFQLGDLAQYRNKAVNEVITESVKGYLHRSNYNSTGELATALQDLNIDPASVNAHFATLDELMTRRHQIVHRADQDETGGQGHHRVRSIGKKQVKKWVDAVEAFGDTVLNQL